MILQFFYVFFIVFVLDFFWAEYTKSISDGRRGTASFVAFLLIVLSGASIISYTTNHVLLAPAGLGAAAGTYCSMRWYHWVTLDWWKYILQKRVSTDVSWFTTILCRANGHPSGVIYYSAGSDEPDHTCKKCGDDLA